jgi:arsenite-transporting ATPase
MVCFVPFFHTSVHFFSAGQGACAHCDARKRIQQKYLDQISDLYEDFHVIKLPLLTREVRGGKMIEAFSSWLIRPYDPNHPDPVESK